MKHNAIETRYAGHLFRSRLEARWACFFDLVGWPWVYEPQDENGWIPDFAIGAVLVEVKPYHAQEQFDEAIDKAGRALGGANENSPELLLLGTGPFVGMDDDPSIGWLGETTEGMNEEFTDLAGVTCLAGGIWAVDEAPIGHFVGGKIGFCHRTWSYRDRVSGQYDGCQPNMEMDELTQLWGQAHERTRWNPGRRMTPGGRSGRRGTSKK